MDLMYVNHLPDAKPTSHLTEVHPQSDGELAQTKDLRPKDRKTLQNQGLLMVKDPKGGDLEFGEEWSQKAIDKWVRRLFPKVFEWLDIHFGCPDQDENKYQWVLLQRDRADLFIVQRDTITGDDLRDVMGTVGRRWQDQCIRIGETPYCSFQKT
jgi:hypothetical protein